MPNENLQVLISAAEIAARVSALSHDIAGKLPSDFIIVSLLRGSFVFTSDLIRALHNVGNMRLQVDFMTLASYHKGTESTGNVQLVRDLTESVEDRDVLIVDDILESGRTLTYARDLILSRNAKSVQIAVLLEKPGKRKVEIEANFVGFIIPDKFVVGYGLDYANYYRELPYVGVITET